MEKNTVSLLPLMLFVHTGLNNVGLSLLKSSSYILKSDPQSRSLVVKLSAARLPPISIAHFTQGAMRGHHDIRAEIKDVGFLSFERSYFVLLAHPWDLLSLLAPNQARSLRPRQPACRRSSANPKGKYTQILETLLPPL